MREDEAGMRYLRPLVKQDLAKLNTDGESRQLALKSLKQSIEQLDAISMPKFLSQIAESREYGVSQSHVISLYEEVAKVHGKLIKPHIPRVMSSIIRALAASGSSPQLQQACAKVTAAMAKYTIDSTMSIEVAEEIIKGICDPLVEVLIGKLQPVAAGAAACIHGIIETENWKYASVETIQEVCQRITIALSEKSMHTVSHLQLASKLASINPEILRFYGAMLLKTSETILKSTTESWQHRKVATKLLQAMLMILDKETLEIEIDSAIYALECCRFDKMPHVRVAVNEALFAAKKIASNDSNQSYGMLTSPLCKSVCKSEIEHCSSTWTKSDIDQSHNQWKKEDIEQSKRLWTKEDSLNYPYTTQKQIVSPNSQESNQLSFSPASTSTTESLRIRHISTRTQYNNSQRSNMSPLYLTRSIDFGPSSRCNSPNDMLSTMDYVSSEREFTPQKFLVVDAKENVPVKISNVNHETYTSQEVEHLEVQARENLTVLLPLKNACKSLSPSPELDKFEVDMIDLETKDCNYAKGFTYQSLSRIEKETPMLTNFIIPIASTTLDVQLTKTMSDVSIQDDMKPLLQNSQAEEVCNNSNQSHPTQQNENCAHDYDFGGTNECKRGETRNLTTTTIIVEDHALGCEGSVDNLVVESGALQRASDAKYCHNILAHLDIDLEKPQLCVTDKKDLLPSTSPKLLTNELQLSSSPKIDSKRITMNKGVALCQGDGASTLINIDVEVSSEACCGMHDNQMTLDQSFQGDVLHEESEDNLMLLYKDVQLHDIQPSNHVSVQDIQMVSSTSCSSTVVQVQESRSSQPNAFEATLPNCIPSNLTQIHNNNNECDTIMPSTFNYRELYICTPCEGRPNSPICKDSNTNMVEKKGLCYNCMRTSEELSRAKSIDKKLCRKKSSKCNNSQSWWENQGLQGRAMLVRLVSKSWKNLCWYGEIIFSGTLCIVLTLPLAIALTKVLSTTPEHLVPT